MSPEFPVSLELTVEIAPTWEGLFDAADVESLKIVVASTSGDTLASVEGPWSLADDGWMFPLAWEHPAGPMDLVTEVELLGDDGVEWSGRTATGRVYATAVEAMVTLYRGPMSNLAVREVGITGASDTVDEGSSVQLSAVVTGGRAADVRLFWSSSDPAVASVDATGLVTGASPGSASILAVAGPVGDTAVIIVEVVPATVILDPSSALLQSLGEELTVAAVVLESRGDTIPNPILRWESTDSTVLFPIGPGIYEAVAEGEAEIVVTVTERPEVEGRAVVEVDQAVATVTLSPTDTVAGPGATVQFDAVASDANGNPIADVTPVWSTSTPSVATVDEAGLVSTVAQGVTTIEAGVGGVVGVTGFTVLGTSGVTRIWIGGDAEGGADWANQDNWLPRLVPTLVDTVLVEASATEQPVLSADQSVADLVVQDGATVVLGGFQLTVTDDLDAGATIVGPGVVRMIGTDASIIGSLPALAVDGAVTASGDVTVAGDLMVSGAGSNLSVGGNQVTVSGSLQVRDGAVVTMTDPSGSMVVDGEAVFDGASTLDRLTAGELRVRGNFTAWTAEAEGFAPTGQHVTVLDGAVTQTVYLHHNAPGEARFNSLEIDNPGGVVLSSTVRVTGDVALTSGTLGGAQTMVVGGDLMESLGGNQYQVLNTTFTGTPALPQSLQTTATFTASYALAQDLELLGSLVVSGVGASIDVGGRELAISGDLSTAEGGTLVMQNAAGSVDVGGEAFFDGGATTGLLTAGTLRVAENFTAWMSDAQNFAPTGTHRTVLDGSTSQGVYLHHSGPGESRFQILEVDNPAGVELSQTTRVTDDVILTEGTLAGQQTMYIGGNLREVVGGNQYRVLNTTFTGTPQLPPSIQSNVTFASAYTFGQDLTVLGDLMVVGATADLDVGPHLVSVGGDFRTADGGTLTMQSTGVLDVEGEAEFNGGSTLGLLTDGVLRVAGNFTAWTSDTENFAPTGSYRTILDGAAAQTVYLHHSGAGQARFQTLDVTNPAGVTFLGTIRVTDAFTVSTLLTTEVGQATLVAGSFTLEASAILDNQGSVRANTCQLDGMVTGNPVVCP